LDKVLVDTSAWIEFFKKKEPWHSTVSGLMDDKRICCAGIVLAELIQARSRKRNGSSEGLQACFEFLDESVDLWQAAGELSQLLSRKGKSVAFPIATWLLRRRQTR